MTMESLPSILFQVGGEEADMGDIEFKAIKVFQGKLRRQGLTNPTCDSGHAVAAGVDFATITALAGKDLYIASAKLVFFTNPAGGISGGDQVDLMMNGTVIEPARYSKSSNGATSTFEYEFKNIGHKVEAGQVIKLRAVIIDADTEVDGFIECWEEDTGTDPAI